ncbi:transcription factor TFIID complex subunit 8 C-term-domain-containing protein [Lipomyces arxii]|uniref:transcription factor TFIID complex subunit 8 C-term-domain-containing protein n=1 Tax=Lipomyces arxii TaxID=56418 RepID=UPI0034CF735B
MTDNGEDRHRKTQSGMAMMRPAAQVMSSLDMKCSSSALQMISILAEEYLTHLSTELHRITSLRRRTRPGIKDLAFLFTEEGIYTSDLEDEYDRSEFISQPPAVIAEEDQDEMKKLQAWAEQEKELARLVPSRRKKEETAYIPGWMPPLPADHTYRNTGIYAERVTQPRDVRERILEEGKVVEEALRKLGRAGEDTVDVVLLDQDDSDSEEQDEKTKEQKSSKRFDIVAYAQTRRKKAPNPIILHIGKKAKT